jgi:hypothetical protein
MVYAEQLCTALSMCHLYNSEELQYGVYIQSIDGVYIRRHLAPFDMDDEGLIVPDYAHYDVTYWPNASNIDDPIVTYNVTGVSLPMWLSIGSVLVAACESRNLVAMQWLMQRFPDYFGRTKHDIHVTNAILAGVVALGITRVW